MQIAQRAWIDVICVEALPYDMLVMLSLFTHINGAYSGAGRARARLSVRLVLARVSGVQLPLARIRTTAIA